MPALETQIEQGRRFFVEFDAVEQCPLDFLDDPTVVLFFASWAFSVRFGGMHELSRAAMHLERKHKLNLRPLLRYADRNVEDEADRRELERAWQPAADLAQCCRAIATALESGDPTLDELMAGYEHLAPRLRELAAMCDWGEARDLRVRLSFDLSHNEPTAPRPAPHDHGPLLGPLGVLTTHLRDI